MNISEITGLVVGAKTELDPSIEIIITNGGRVTIGDYCSIGKQVKIVCDGTDITIDDWTVIHDRCLFLATKELKIGQQCWFGQSCVVDASGGLEIGNSVRIGMFSQIWSHVAAGERIDGCELFGFRPVVIENGAWLVGTVYVCPGTRIGEKAIVLIGSVVTKDVAPLSVGGGNPYKKRDRISYYKNLTEQERWDRIVGWAREDDEILVKITERQITYSSEKLNGEMRLYRYFSDFQTALEAECDATICCLDNKLYRKTFSDFERYMIKNLSANKIRFLEYRF